MDAARTGNAPGPQLQAVIDELGGERDDARINTVLADNIRIDLTKFTAHGINNPGQWKNGNYYNYKEYVSNEDFEFVQITWVPNFDSSGKKLFTAAGLEEGHYEAQVMKDKITIGVDTWTSGPNTGLAEVSHLKAFVPPTPPGFPPATPKVKIKSHSSDPYQTLFGTNPYVYT